MGENYYLPLLWMYYNQWSYFRVFLDQRKISWLSELQKLEQTSNLHERLSDSQLRATVPSLYTLTLILFRIPLDRTEGKFSGVFVHLY